MVRLRQFALQFQEQGFHNENAIRDAKAKIPNVKDPIWKSRKSKAKTREIVNWLPCWEDRNTKQVAKKKATPCK